MLMVLYMFDCPSRPPGVLAGQITCKLNTREVHKAWFRKRVAIMLCDDQGLMYSALWLKSPSFWVKYSWQYSYKCSVQQSGDGPDAGGGLRRCARRASWTGWEPWCRISAHVAHGRSNP